MTPGRLSSVAGADDPSTVMEANLSVLGEEIYQRPATYVDDEQNTIIGPPTTGDHVLQEFWRDSLGAEYVCIDDADSGTWIQIRPAIVTAEPSSPPTGYWILRADQNYKTYTCTGSGFVALYLPLAGGTMTGALTLAADPTLSLHAATKAYVDALAGGSLDAKNSCRAATTSNVDLTTGGLLTIDGVTLVAGDRVLVRAQTTGSQNGIYTVNSGAWVRSPDADTSTKVTAGMYCFVVEGTTLGDTGYILTTNDPITLDTTALTFAQFSKGLADGEATDAKIGNRTVDQSLASPADTGALTSLLSWMAGRLKAVTGKSDWKTAPAITLEAISTTYLALSGGTLTGPLDFSGTTNKGLRLVNLTSTQRDALSGASAGQLIWNTTTGQAEFYTGSNWIGLDGISLTQTLTNKTLTRPTITNASETAQTLTDGTTVNWDMDNGGKATLTLGGNRTMAAPTHLRDGGTYILILKQDGTGSRTLTWNSVFKWAAGTAPTLTTTASATDILTFVSDGTNLYGVAQNAFA